MKNYEKVDLAYNFLIEQERTASTFTLEQFAAAAGWQKATCRSYISKRYHQYIKKENNDYSSTDIHFLSKDGFRKLHSQKTHEVNAFTEEAVLINKSREFALLAVSIYNNPFTEFKTYGYIVNIIIAYTALFHAIFKRNGTDYYHKSSAGSYILIDGEKKAWELGECCNHFWSGGACPEKSNLEFLIGLRNKIEHRSLPAIDLVVSGECQAALNNFEDIITSNFGSKYALLQNLSMAMQLTSVSEDAQINALKQLQSHNYNIIREYMESFKNSLNDEILQSQKYRIRIFLLPKLGNHASSSDFTVEFIKFNDIPPEELENYYHLVTMIKEVSTPFTLSPTNVRDIVQEVIPDFSMPIHTKCWKYYNARPAEKRKFNGEFAEYHEGFKQYAYSKKWVEFLKEKLSDPVEYERVKNFS